MLVIGGTGYLFIWRHRVKPMPAATGALYTARRVLVCTYLCFDCTRTFWVTRLMCGDRCLLIATLSLEFVHGTCNDQR